MSPERLDEDQRARIAASRPALDTELAREVAAVITHLLDDTRSIIDPDAKIWTAAAANDLRARIENNPLVGPGQGQWEKLDLQLRGASREVVLLAAELVFLREHPLRAALPETRRAHVEGVLSNLEEVVAIPDQMSRWLARPAGTAGFEPGTWYNGALWRHLIWGCMFIRHWNNIEESQREVARGSAWELQQVMLGSGTDRSDIRNVLQFLAQPDEFEPIASAATKAKIRDALCDRVGGSTGESPSAIDHDLLRIRAALAAEIDGPFHFWSEGVLDLWDSTSISPESLAPDSADLHEPRPRHYWLYSPGAQASEWSEFSANGIMAIGWDGLNDLSTYPNREAIRQTLDVDGTGGSMKNAVLAAWQFQNEIAVGDIVYAKRGRREIVGRGVVTSDARFEPGRSSFRHVRSVRWDHKGSWEHPGDAVTKTLTNITPYRDYVENLETLVVGDLADEELSIPASIPTYDKNKFLNDVYLSEAHYERLVSLLRRKKNVILAGPPGVGKTYAAKRLAYSMMGTKDPRRVQVVQFHQSYSYEDFMMGYRPNEAGGFTLAEGPFYRFCEAARDDDEDRPYFFIIDEINRGNISKIFGELLMLIEADKRGQELRLLYKNENFSVPPQRTHHRHDEYRRQKSGCPRLRTSSTIRIL